MLKKTAIIIASLILILFLFLQFYVPPIPEKHGMVDTELFLGAEEGQPLVVGFGGGEGGNAWASDYWKDVRDQFIDQGYPFLAIGYFGMENTSAELDRISLNAIHNAIMEAAKNPLINKNKIALIGGSKGGELILNLASRYPEYSAIVGIVPSHVSFPAVNVTAASSSWIYNDEEVPFVPMTWSSAPSAMKGDLHGAFSIMMEDSEAVEKARIPVEKINGDILLVSATNDEMWPSTQMSEEIINRLKQHNFDHYYNHIAIEGSHTAPLDHFALIFDFLEEHFK